MVYLHFTTTVLSTLKKVAEHQKQKSHTLQALFPTCVHVCVLRGAGGGVRAGHLPDARLPLQAV